MRATVPSLPERLLERIAREGPISFYDFMRAALYDPADGYYARGAAIGEGGDFLTSPHTSRAFAAALAYVPRSTRVSRERDEAAAGAAA